MKDIFKWARLWLHTLGNTPGILPEDLLSMRHQITTAEQKHYGIVDLIHSSHHVVLPDINTTIVHLNREKLNEVLGINDDTQVLLGLMPKAGNED